MSVKQAINAIIRPPRTKYDINKLPRVLETDDEEDGGGIFIRIPLEIELPRDKLIIRGSIYHSGLMKLSNPGPCVVYMHGNASSQLEGQFLVPNLCPYKVFVVCFDFIGCGCSDGKYVSLGYFEKGDTEFLLKILREKYHLGPFILWGRSMGAATALIVDDPSVAGIVSDSGFTSIRNMVKAVARQHNIGKVFMKPTLWMLKSKIEKKAHFDMNSVSPEAIIPKKTVPVLFAQATDDKLIPFNHCERLFAAYGGKDKQLIKLTGGHNGRRSLEFIKTGVKFSLEKLGITPRGLIISPCRKLMKSDFHFETFDKMIGNTSAAEFDKDKFCKEVAKAKPQPQSKPSEDDESSTMSFNFDDSDDSDEEDNQEENINKIAEALEEEELYEEDCEEEFYYEEDDDEEKHEVKSTPKEEIDSKPEEVKEEIEEAKPEEEKKEEVKEVVEEDKQEENKKDVEEVKEDNNEKKEEIEEAKPEEEKKAEVKEVTEEAKQEEEEKKEE